MPTSFPIRVQAIRSRGQNPRLYINFPLALAAAIDGHAKNFSLFLLPGGAYRLTPRYDVLSAHPVLGNGRGRLARQKVRMAMAVWGANRHYRQLDRQGRVPTQSGFSPGLCGSSFP